MYYKGIPILLGDFPGQEGSSLVYQGVQHRVFIGQVVVRLSIQIQVGVDGIAVQCASRSHLVFCICQSPEGEMVDSVSMVNWMLE
jgi:hypothetical protein